MMQFSQPLWFLLALPFIVLWAILLGRSRSALHWLKAHVSSRFIRNFTLYGKKGFFFHMMFLLLMGAMLIVAAAGPYKRGMVEQTKATGNVILLLDASFSMLAKDTFPHRDKEKDLTRFEQAKLFALELVDLLPDYHVGLISFSGIAALHSPPTKDHQALKSMIRYLSTHRYKKTGSHFGRAFEAVLHMVQDRKGTNQVVMLSDGELPYALDFDEELGLLEKCGAPVFTVGVGSKNGWKMDLYDPRDVVNRVEHPSTAITFTTRRDDGKLKKIARRTGGEYLNLEKGGWTNQMADLLKEAKTKPVKVEGPGKKDLSFYPAALFLILFLIETLLIAGARRRAETLTIFILLPIVSYGTAGCSLWRADKFNEMGLDEQGNGQYEQARPLFEKSNAAGYRQEIPLYNLANNYLEERDYSSAHSYYQKAMEVSPELSDAYFNDGHALYMWGRTELKRGGAQGGKGETEQDVDAEEQSAAAKQCEKKCSTTRTQQLWIKAKGRFEQAAETAGKDSSMREESLKNIEVIKQQIQYLARWFSACMRRCMEKEKPPAQEKEEGGGGGGGDGEGKADSGGGKKGKDEKEGGGGGGGGDEEERKTSKEEQKKIEEELERIHKRTSESKYFNQSGAQQDPVDEDEKGKLPSADNLYW